MGKDIVILGVPTEAGTHFAGQSRAPETVISKHDLVGRLKAQGYGVQVILDVFWGHVKAESAAKWQPGQKVNGVRNEGAALEVMQILHEFIVGPHMIGGGNLAASFPIFIGGDCTSTPSILAALSKVAPGGTRIGLMYMDGDVDLTLPSQAAANVDATGMLDSMVMTHLTLRPGALDSMKRFTANDGRPVSTAANTVLFGFDPLQPSNEHWVYMLEQGFKAFTRPTVKRDPTGCARAALEWLESRVDHIVLHFDVDVIDSAEFPLANFPHYAGLEADQAFEALNVFLASPNVSGLIITQVNPNNDPDGIMAQKLVDAITEGFSKRKH